MDAPFDMAILAAIAFTSADAAGVVMSSPGINRSSPMRDLVAVGAPSRPLVATILCGYALLLGLYGYLLYRDHQDYSVRAIGQLLVAIAVLTVVTTVSFPFHLHDRPHFWIEALHLACVSVTAVLMAAAMITSLRTLEPALRVFTLGCLLVFTIGALAVLLQAPAYVNSLETPLIGVFQRFAMYSFVAWLCGFAFGRRHSGEARDDFTTRSRVAH